LRRSTTGNICLALSPRACQVTTARCTPTPHPSPSIHIGWVVASGNRTPNLTFNTLSARQMLPVALHFFVTSLSPRACQVTIARCTPTSHPSPSIHTGWAVVT